MNRMLLGLAAVVVVGAGAALFWTGSSEDCPASALVGRIGLLEEGRISGSS